MSVDKTQNDELNIHKSPKDLTSVTTKTTENLDLQSQADEIFYHDSRLSLSLSSRLILMISLVGVIGTGFILKVCLFCSRDALLTGSLNLYIKKLQPFIFCETYLVSVEVHFIYRLMVLPLAIDNSLLTLYHLCTVLEEH